MKKSKKELFVSLGLLAAFVVWTFAVKLVDVKMIGPEGSCVGFATINSCVHEFFGVHMSLYNITDLLSLVPLFVVGMFAFMGLVQCIKRKSILKVDYNILVLGVYYMVVMAVFLLFEEFAVNFRPILIEGVLEASYPSSTTMLTMCVMPTLVMMLNKRDLSRKLFYSIAVVVYSFTALMVLARLVSGVHWFSDIVGGILLSFGLVFMFGYFLKKKG